jgi:hypothetical protein
MCAVVVVSKALPDQPLATCTGGRRWCADRGHGRASSYHAPHRRSSVVRRTGIGDATTVAIPIREAATRYRNISLSPATGVGPLPFLAPSPLPIKPRTSAVSFRKPQGTIEIASPKRKPPQLCFPLVSLRPTRQGDSRLCDEPMSVKPSARDPRTLATYATIVDSLISFVIVALRV